jgi:hypothetical protein
LHISGNRSDDCFPGFRIEVLHRRNGGGIDLNFSGNKCFRIWKTVNSLTLQPFNYSIVPKMALSIIIVLYLSVGLLAAAGSILLSQKLFSAKGEQIFVFSGELGKNQECQKQQNRHNHER